jgi:hypothetical protein
MRTVNVGVRMCCIVEGWVGEGLGDGWDFGFVGKLFSIR